MQKLRLISFALLAALVVLAVIEMWSVTSKGIGVSPDSTVYLAGAKNLADGHGYVVPAGRAPALQPVSHYPPLYPAVIALLSLSGLDIETAARVLGTLLFVANGLLIFLILSREIDGPSVIPLLGAVLFYRARDLIEIHSMAWSEPLFIFFCLLTVLLLSRFLEKPSKRLLIACSLAAGLGFLTRYVGVVFCGSAALSVLLLYHGPTKKRFQAAAAIFVLAILPGALWMVRNSLLAGSATNRRIAFHPMVIAHLKGAGSTFGSWIAIINVGNRHRPLLLAIEIAVVSILLVLFFVRGSSENRAVLNQQPWRVAALCLIFISCYLGFLIFNAWFIEYDSVFDFRSLAPVHALGIIAVLLAARNFAAALISSHRVQSAQAIIIFTVLLITISSGSRFPLSARAVEGRGYKNAGWSESPTMNQVKSNVPEGTLIYSNAQDAVLYLTGRWAAVIPEKVFRGTAKPNPDYEQQMLEMIGKLKADDGILVFSDKVPERWSLPTRSDIQAQTGLVRVADFPDGAIYKAK